MFRPPAREMCLNTVEDVYQTCKFTLPVNIHSYHISNMRRKDEESRPAAGKVLTKWRPQSTVLETAANAAPEQSEAKPVTSEP